jgi:hypothetical protein
LPYHRRGRAGILFYTHNQTLSEPIRLLQAIVLDEYAPDLRISRVPIHGTEPENGSSSKWPKAQNRSFLEEKYSLHEFCSEIWSVLTVCDKGVD